MSNVNEEDIQGFGVAGDTVNGNITYAEQNQVFETTSTNVETQEPKKDNVDVGDNVEGDDAEGEDGIDPIDDDRGDMEGEDGMDHDVGDYDEVDCEDDEEEYDDGDVEGLEDEGDIGKASGGESLHSRRRRKKRSFDPRKVNWSLTLQDLKLEGITMCYKMSPSWHQQLKHLKNLCDLCKSSFNIVQHNDNKGYNNTGLYQNHVTMYINDVRVCDGYGEHNFAARRDATFTAIKFLEHKGLRFWECERLAGEHIWFVNWNQIENLGRGQAGHFKDAFKEGLVKFLQGFLDDPLSVCLRVNGVGNAKKWKLSQLRTIGNCLKLKMRHKKGHGELNAYKVNSILHNLAPPPPPLQPEQFPEFSIQQVDRGPGPPRLRIYKDVETYNPSMTNEELSSIECLNLNSFHGVLQRKWTSTGIISGTTASVNVPCEFKDEVPNSKKRFTRCLATLFINNIFVAKGYGKTMNDSREKASKNALLFLMYLGLHVVYEDKIADVQIKEVSRDDILSTSFEEHFLQFLASKKLLKLKFNFPTTEEERALFLELCKTHSLTDRCGKSELAALKKDNTKMELEVLLFPERKEQGAPPSTEMPDPAEPGGASIACTVISETMFSYNPSIRSHVEEFVESGEVVKLQFPNCLDKTQKELVEVLSEKHELTYSVNEDGNVVISKRQNMTEKKKDEEVPVGSISSTVRPKPRLSKTEKKQLQRMDSDIPDYFFPEKTGKKRKRKGQSNPGPGGWKRNAHNDTSYTPIRTSTGKDITPKRNTNSYRDTSYQPIRTSTGKEITPIRTSSDSTGSGRGKRSAPKWSSPKWSANQESSYNSIQPSTRKDISPVRQPADNFNLTRTVKNNNVMTHFVQSRGVDRHSHSGPSPGSFSQDRDSRSASQKLLQSRSSHDRIRDTDHHSQSRNWGTRNSDHNRDQYEHRSSRDTQYYEPDSSRHFNPYDSPFTTSSQSSQYNRNYSGDYRDRYSSHQGSSRDRDRGGRDSRDSRDRWYY